MEALTGASVAALTVYDMCKALSHEIVIGDVRLIEKSGGKRRVKQGRVVAVKIKLLYFASLADRAGRSEETRDTAATTPRDLYAEVAREHGFRVSVRARARRGQRRARRRGITRSPTATKSCSCRRYRADEDAFRAQRHADRCRGANASALEHPAAGGCVTFEGWVRNHNEARAVTRLDYQAYAPLAESEGEAILDEALRDVWPARRALRASRRRARDRRHGGVGRRQRRSSRRRVRGVPLDHRRSEAARADLEERALRGRRIRLAASGQHARRQRQPAASAASEGDRLPSRPFRIVQRLRQPCGAARRKTRRARPRRRRIDRHVVDEDVAVEAGRAGVVVFVADLDDVRGAVGICAYVDGLRRVVGVGRASCWRRSSVPRCRRPRSSACPRHPARRRGNANS